MTQIEKKTWTVTCPECGESRETERAPTRDKGGTFETHFCSLRCERNYRYRQDTRNIWTGQTRRPEDVKKWG